MKIDVQTWLTPNFITLKTSPGLRQDGWKEAPKVALKDADAETLAELCAAFRAEVFRKAGKTDPAITGDSTP